MERWAEKVAIVTGASAGIGAAVCKALVEQGMTVVGFARREDKLKALQKEIQENMGTFHYMKVDVRNEKNILDAFAWVMKTMKSVDVLVNNAGVLKTADFLGTTSDWKNMFDTNVMGVNICTREAVKIMKELKIDGQIININSCQGGHQILPYMKDIAMYGATKFCLSSLTESFRELMCMQKTTIRVSNISPGMTNTDMCKDIVSSDTQLLEPSDVADAVVFVLTLPQHINISELALRNINDPYYRILKDTLDKSGSKVAVAQAA